MSQSLFIYSQRAMYFPYIKIPYLNCDRLVFIFYLVKHNFFRYIWQQLLSSVNSFSIMFSSRIFYGDRKSCPLLRSKCTGKTLRKSQLKFSGRRTSGAHGSGLKHLHHLNHHARCHSAAFLRVSCKIDAAGNNHLRSSQCSLYDLFQQ